MSTQPVALFTALADQFWALLRDGPELSIWFVGRDEREDRPLPFAEQSVLLWEIGHPFSAPCSHPAAESHNLTSYPAIAVTTKGVSVKNGRPVPNPEGIRQRERMNPLAAQVARHLTPDQLAP
jgi:hypothetical protein